MSGTQRSKIMYCDCVQSRTCFPILPNCFFSLTWFSFEKKLRFEPQKARNILDRLVSFHETTGDQTKSFANSLFIGTVYIRTLYKAKETLERKLED